MEHNTTADTDLEYDTSPQASFCGLHGRMRVVDPNNPPAMTSFDNNADVRCGWFGKQKRIDAVTKQLSLF